MSSKAMMSKWMILTSSLNLFLLSIISPAFADPSAYETRSFLRSPKEKGVQNIVAEADYRAVKLNWKYLHGPEPPSFRVKYCEEMSQWQSKVKCKQRVFLLSRAIYPKGKFSHKNLPPEQLLGKLIRLEKGSYQTSITDLRMSTNYTFSIEANFHAFPHEGSSLYHSSAFDKFEVSVETKGFSGKTIKCLGNQSEVAVNTGPFFDGKISVEGAPIDSDSRCSLYGNHSSSKEIYTMTINHVLCGSKVVNNSSVETMIIVHENKEILTHNSRRFLVVCNFPSETYTFTASVEVPPHLLKKKRTGLETESFPRMMPKIPSPSPASRNPSTTDDASILINIADKYKFNSMRDSRILASPAGHRVMQRMTRSSSSSSDAGETATSNLGDAVIISIAVVGSVILLAVGVVIHSLTRSLSKRRCSEGDLLSQRNDNIYRNSIDPPFLSSHQSSKKSCSSSSCSLSITPSSPSTSSRKSLFV